jgi:large subunit ribosomal protein L24
MSQTLKIKKGDVVRILRGKDRGTEGRVLEMLPKEGRVRVENLNLVKRHRRPRPITNASRMGGTQMIPGGIFDVAQPLPVSNVMVVCPTCKKPTRIATVTKTVKDKTVRVRVCKNPGCGQEIDK